MADKKLYLLLTFEGQTCGIYSSKERLHEAVEYWIEELCGICPIENLVLVCEEWFLDYEPEPDGWEWAYIGTNVDVQELAEYGATIPDKRFLGRNLIKLKWWDDE